MIKVVNKQSVSSSSVVSINNSISAQPGKTIYRTVNANGEIQVRNKAQRHSVNVYQTNHAIR